MSDAPLAGGEVGGGPKGPPPTASAPGEPGVLDPGHPLHQVLAEARRRGALGRAPLHDQIAHSLGFLEALPAGPSLVADLGPGGGVPGLVIAVARPALRLVLIEAASRRCAQLREAVTALGVDDRVEVTHQRAEDAGRGGLRGRVDAVVARSFGPPAVTAECAAPLLRVGGTLVVSEPPDDRDRWPAAALTQLGLVPGRRWRSAGTFQALVQESTCPDRFPRRPGIPAKRPLF